MSETDGGDGSDGSVEPACKVPDLLLIDVDSHNLELKIGFTGFGHGLKLNEGLRFAVEPYNCNDACECDFRGPLRVPGDPVNHQRCIGNTSVACNSDADCENAGGQCEFHLGPAVPFKITQVEACTAVRFNRLSEPVNGSTDPIQGRIDLIRGDARISEFSIKSEVYLFCGQCANDTPYDGNKGGKCSQFLTPNYQGSCDTTGISPTGTRHSYECPPASKNGSFELNLALETLRTDSVMKTVTAQSPNCAVGGGKCFCGSCSGSAGKSMCFSDRDCAAGSTCDPVGATEPDSCGVHELFTGYKDTQCRLSQTDEELSSRGMGRCMSSLRNSFLVSGGTECFAGGGSTTDSKLIAKGSTSGFIDGKAQAVVAAVTCFPATGFALFDEVAGQPGPAHLEMPIVVEKYFAD